MMNTSGSATPKHWGILVITSREEEIPAAITALPWCEIEMPCGHTVSKADVVPQFGLVPCPCGNPNHILYEVQQMPANAWEN